MNAKVKTMMYEMLVSAIVISALTPIVIVPTGLGAVDNIKSILIVTALVCPYVFIVLVYALIPLWRPLKRADFLQVGGIGLLGLLWTNLIFSN